jgi:hypothetical protein
LIALDAHALAVVVHTGHQQVSVLGEDECFRSPGFGRGVLPARRTEVIEQRQPGLIARLDHDQLVPHQQGRGRDVVVLDVVDLRPARRRQQLGDRAARDVPPGEVDFLQLLGDVRHQRDGIAERPARDETAQAIDGPCARGRRVDLQRGAELGADHGSSDLDFLDGDEKRDGDLDLDAPREVSRHLGPPHLDVETGIGRGLRAQPVRLGERGARTKRRHHAHARGGGGGSV